MAKKPPKLFEKRGHGAVTLTDKTTKFRRQYWLGPWDEPSTREAYHRLIAEWESLGRRLPERPDRAESPMADERLTIDELVVPYCEWALAHYSASECCTITQAVRVLRQHFGSTPAEEFGPNRLREVRDAMVRGDDSLDPPRRPWSRRQVNNQVQRICAIFRWGAAHELVPITAYQSLKALPGLKRGRCDARETAPVRAVDETFIEAVTPYVSRQVLALIRLQYHTGARGGELFGLRPIDITIDDGADVWSIDLAEHKTAHWGKRRTIVLGPAAQETIKPFLAGRAVDSYLFSPREAEKERLAERHTRRRTPLSCGNAPGTNRVESPEREPGDRYTSNSYRRAIDRACAKAWPLPPELRRRRGEGGLLETKEEFLARVGRDALERIAKWRRDHRWHPHQLRHTAGTRIRREFGLEAAAVVLGHSSALVTDAVYAERDLQKVAEVMRRIG
ncbi:MAG: site-specific integrase [Phycisphaerae bacterium]|nr:site-specific integrase [Phycisphaerae bacterium]